ncbi:MAG: phosphohydrolase, partial [Actinomycetota bacterium]|nr:phosphohydrolase [Actinomycetota bacterium]
MAITTTDLHTLYGDLLSELTPDRIQHSLAVGARVAAHADSAPAWARADLIAAAVLHDVGYSPSHATLGFHPLDGAT